MDLSTLEQMVHNCVKCKDHKFGYAIQHYPILSFGDIEHKSLIVVGLNPSTKEYEDGYVNGSSSIEERHISQINYFKSKPYTFFKHLAKFFNDPVKSKLGWVKNPWEAVGYLDIVKCPIRVHPRARKQWSSLSQSEKKGFIQICSPYLMLQLELIDPTLVIAYGADVCHWFYPKYTQSLSLTSRTCKILTGQKLNVLFVPQTRGSHSKDIIESVKAAIVDNM